MNELLRIFRVQVRVRLGLSQLKWSRGANPSQYRKRVGMVILAGFGILYILGFYCVLLLGLFSVSTPLGHAELPLALSVLGSQLLTLVFGLFYIIGALFFAKDSTLLASLPVRPWQVFGAKMLSVYSGELLVSAAIFVPACVLYMLFAGAGALFALRALVVLLLLPAVPLALASVLALLFMGVLGRFRHRGALATIFGFAALIAVMVGSSLFNTRLGQGAFDENSLRRLLESTDGLVRAVGGIFPPSVWASLGATEGGAGGWGYLALFVAAALVAGALAIFLGGRIYYAGVRVQLESSQGRRRKGALRFAKAAGSPVRAQAVIEIKRILRETSYAINALSGIVIVPIMLVIPRVTMGNDPKAAGEMTNMMRQGGAWVALGIAAVSAFVILINPAAATSFSREGRAMWLPQSLPVPARLLVRGRLVVAAGISFAGALATVLAMVFAWGVPLWVGALALAVSLPLSVACSALSLLIDMSRPKQQWESPQEAVKQNMNVMLAMGADLVLLTACAVPVIPLLILGAPPLAACGGVFLLACGAAVLCTLLLENGAQSAFRRMAENAV